MTDIIQNRYNITSVKDKTIKNAKENIKCCELGRIVKIDNTGIEVSLLSKIKYYDNIENNVVIKCLATTGYNKTGGYKQNYEVGNVVVVLFTDTNYEDFFLTGGDVIREPLYNKKIHSINNGIIIARIDEEPEEILLSNKESLFCNNAEIGIDTETEKIIIQNETEQLKTINISLVNKIKELITLIKGLQTAVGGFINASSLDAVNFDEIITKNNNLFK